MSTSNNVGINKIITENDWTTMLHSAAHKIRTVLLLKINIPFLYIKLMTVIFFT